jgi:hypothetical protein
MNDLLRFLMLRRSRGGAGTPCCAFKRAQPGSKIVPDEFHRFSRARGPSEQLRKSSSAALQLRKIDRISSLRFERCGRTAKRLPLDAFSTVSLKKERIKKQMYKNRELAIADVANCIDTFYNRTRRHSHLGRLSPEHSTPSTRSAGNTSTESWELHFLP